MKILIIKPLLFLTVMISLFFQGCDVGYKYDIESGTDDYKSDGSNVTIDTSKSIDVSMYDRARIFPGLVDTARERRIVDTSIRVNLALNYLNPNTLGVTATPAPIYSSGLYAGAGELVTIDVDGEVNGLSIQVGSHKDDLTNAGTTSREPIVFTKKALFPGRNYVRNNLGGYIWIIKESNFSGSDNFNLKFGNVYRAPDFISGSNTNVTSWAQEIKNTSVPWLELRGKHIAFSVSRARILNKIQENGTFVSSIENLINTWDNVIESYYYKYYSLTPNASDLKFRAPEFPERVVLDVQLKDNVYMRWTGQPIVALNTNAIVSELTDLDNLLSGNARNIFTAIGNNYSMIRTPWWSDVATASKSIPLFRLTENSFKQHLIPKMSDIFLEAGAGINTQFPLALSYAKVDSSKWLKKDLGTNYDAFALLPLIQLANYNNDDYKLFIKLNRMMKENVLYYGLESFYTELCNYHKVDFAPFFDHWGIDIPDAARQASAQYPLLNKTIWAYNPLSATPEQDITNFDGSKYIRRHDRSNWEVVTLDKNYTENVDYKNNRLPDYMFDGLKSTFYQSKWDGGNPPLPYYIVIDMKEEKTINGFYIAKGGGASPPSHLIIETTSASQFELDDNNIKWSNIADVKAQNSSTSSTGVKLDARLQPPSTVNEQYYYFTFPRKMRYIRFKIDQNNFKNEPIQTISELGTF